MQSSSDELKEKIKLDKLPTAALNESRGVFGGLGREFREFVARGNAVDLAVGVSIGTAFSNLIQSFMQNIVSPPVRMAMTAIRGGAQSIQSSVAGTTGFDWTSPQNGPGAFLGHLGSFLILAFATFMVVKVVNRFKKALEQRALTQPADASPDPSYEDTSTRLIAQNDRIIHLLEQLNARSGAVVGNSNIPN